MMLWFDYGVYSSLLPRTPPNHVAMFGTPVRAFSHFVIGPAASPPGQNGMEVMAMLTL